MSSEGEKPGRKRGGQPKDPADRKGRNLTFRVRDGLRSRLGEAAAESGRSISEVIERCIERAFEWEEAFASVVDYKQEMVEKHSQIGEDTAFVILQESGCPISYGTPFGTVVSLPGSIAQLPDGQVGRVKRKSSPADPFEIEAKGPAGWQVVTPITAPEPSSADDALDARLERAVERVLARAGLLPAKGEGSSP